MRVAFFGSPAYAIPTLERLALSHEIVLVVSQPDAPAGRGMTVKSPAVAQWARAREVPLLQPSRVRDAAFEDEFSTFQPDVAVTVAYGQILPATLLAIPQHGFLNAHGSILPELRGAAPIQWALIRGFDETGVTIMTTDPGLDTGPIRLIRRLPISPDATARELSDALSELSASAMAEALDLLERGELPSLPQDDDAATYAPLLTKDDGNIRWTDSSTKIVNRFRGVALWPGSRFRFRDNWVRVGSLGSSDAVSDGGSPGTIVGINPAGVHVKVGDGAVCVVKVTPPGKSSLPADAWANAMGLRVGDDLA